MEANFGYNRLTVRDNTTKIFVPENDIARLMFYLKCVFIVLKCNSFYE